MDQAAGIKKHQAPIMATLGTLLITSFYKISFEKVPEIEQKMQLTQQRSEELKYEIKEMKDDLKEIKKMQIEMYREIFKNEKNK
jgi:hypothetical protein